MKTSCKKLDRLIRFAATPRLGLLAACCALMLTACSGGGGGDDNADQVSDDRYAFAKSSGVSVSAADGVLANDGSDFQSVELASGVNSASSLTLNADGSFTYTPGSGVSTDGFTYRAVDKDGDKVLASVSIFTVPQTSGCTEYNVDSASSGTTFKIFQNNVGEDDGMNFTVSEQPIRGTLGPMDADTGEVTYTHSNGTRGLDTFKVRITDRFGGSSEVNYDIAVVPVRVMPLGDSLTEGVESDSDASGNPDLDTPAMNIRTGYRKRLFDLLNNSGYSFDFVGSQTDAGFASFADFQHQGHPGYTDAEISGIADPNGSNSNEFNPNTDGVYRWLSSNPADLILLHAGTNNVNVRTSSVFMERILDEIDRWESDNSASVTTMVAKIIDKGERGNDDPNPNNNVETYNSNVQGLVNNRISQGDNLVLVDMYSAVPSSLLDPFDKTHLTPSGYQAMAEGWKDSIDNASAIAKCN